MSYFLEMFALPLAACAGMVVILPCVGLHVLKREVIFIDIALAQFAAVGALVAHVVFHVHGCSLWGYTAAFASALVAAGFYAFARSRVQSIGLETVIGVTYALAAAGALFITGVAPGGHVHVQNMLAGSVLLTTGADVLRAAAGFAVAGLGFALCRKPFARISENRAAWHGGGLRVAAWDFLFYALTGLVITLAVSTGGVVLVFALLIMPATTSAIFSQRWGTRLVLAWAIGAVAGVGGVFFADRFDFSVGPSISMVLVVVVVGAGLYSLIADGGRPLQSACGADRVYEEDPDMMED